MFGRAWLADLANLCILEGLWGRPPADLALAHCALAYCDSRYVRFLEVLVN